MFKNYPSVTYWKAELTVFTTINEKNTSGISSIIFKSNQIPYNGTCHLIGNLTGYALDTYFKLKCSDWVDDDGYITFYKIYGNYMI